MRIVCAERDFSAIAQRDRYCVEARNIVKPTVRRVVNAPAIPPPDPNPLASDNFRKRHFLADNAGSKRCAQSFIVYCNFESVEHNEAGQQDNRNNYWRCVMACQSAAGNQNDREKGPNDYVTDLRVFVTRHKSLSGIGGGLAAC